MTGAGRCARISIPAAPCVAYCGNGLDERLITWTTGFFTGGKVREFEVCFSQMERMYADVLGKLCVIFCWWGEL